MTDPVETMKMSRDSNEEYLVPGIEEEIEFYVRTRRQALCHVIPDEGESVGPKI